MNKWFKNISFSIISKGIAMIFLFLTDIIAARRLEVELYAEWSYFYSILSMLFWLGWCGINISAKVHVARCDNEEDKTDCIISALWLRLLASVIICTLVGLLLPQLAKYLGYPEKYHNLKWLFLMAAFMVFFDGFAEFFKELFMGLNRFDYQLIITAVEYVGIFIFAFGGLSVNKSIKSVVFSYIIAGIMVLIVGMVLLKKYVFNYKWAIRNHYVTRLFKYAIPIALIGIGGVILVDMDTFMLGLFSTKENVAIYGIAKNICSKAIHVNNAFISGVMVTFSIIDKKNYFKKNKDYKKALKINIVITAVVSVLLLCLSDLAIDMLYGSNYSESAKIIKMLVLYYFLFGLSTFASNFLDYRGKAGSRGIWYMSIVIINLIFNYLWIPKYGAKGAAWATGISLIPYTIYSCLACAGEWRKIKTNLLMEDSLL